MIIGVAEDVLLDVFVLTGVMLVLEPQRNGEVTRQIVSHGLGRHHHSGRSIKQVHLADEAGGQKKKKRRQTAAEVAEEEEAEQDKRINHAARRGGADNKVQHETRKIR